MAFLKKSSADPIAEAEKQVADLVQKIAATRTELDRAEAAATASAFSGDGLDDAVTTASKAQLMLRAFERAKAQADDRVVALRQAKLDADNAARREQAVAKLHQLRDEAIDVRRKLIPLVNKVRELSVAHDSVVQEYARSALRPLLDPVNAALLAPDAAREGFSGLSDLIARNDGEADSLATRVLRFQPPVLTPVE
jgi:hypothetical protein